MIEQHYNSLSVKVFFALIATWLMIGSTRVCAQRLTAEVVELDSLMFPEQEALIGTIDDLDIGTDGDIFIVDRLGQQVFGFSKDGKLKVKVSPEVCDPGFSFTPWALSVNRSYMFLQNDGPWGFLFHSDGRCLSNVDDNYLMLLKAGLTANNRLFGILRGFGERPYKLVVADIDGRTIKEMEIPDSDFTVADKFIEGGGLAAKGDIYYFAPSVSPVLYELNMENNSVTKIDISKKINLDTPSEDLPAGDINPAFVQQASQIVLGRDINRGVYIIEDKYLFVQYSHASKTGGDWKWLIYDLENEEVQTVQESSFGLFRIIDDEGYRLIQPPLDNDNNLPNPYFKKYKLNIRSN